MKGADLSYDNQKTRITSAVLGVLLGLAGVINHGIFEILQGNTPTGGFMIEAIGQTQRFWTYGTEGAFTLVHNFLATGICAVLISLAIIIWSLKFIQFKHGAAVFLLLLISLTLVGGGLGHIVLFLPTWAYSTRINSSLDWWKRILPKKIGKLWMPMLVLTALSWFIVMELGIFGIFPGQKDPETILNICLEFVLLTVVLANITFISGFARDIDERTI